MELPDNCESEVLSSFLSDLSVGHSALLMLQLSKCVMCAIFGSIFLWCIFESCLDIKKHDVGRKTVLHLVG